MHAVLVAWRRERLAVAWLAFALAGLGFAAHPTGFTLLAPLLAQSGAAAAVPPLVVVSTVKAGLHFASGAAATGLISSHVLTLTEGALQAMFMTKLKLAAAVVLAVKATEVHLHPA